MRASSLLFLTQLIYQRHLWDVRPYASSFVYLFSSPSLVHFKNGPECLTRGTARIFIPFVKDLLLSFVSSSFLVLLRYQKDVLSSLLVWCWFLPIFPSICTSLFSWNVLIFPWFDSSNQSCVFSWFSLLTWYIFLSNSIPISWVYILTACIRVSNFFVFVFGKQFDVVHTHKVIDHFLQFTKFITAGVFPEYLVE